MTTYQTENKEQRLKINIVLGQKYYLEFRKDQFLVHFFLIFSWYLFLAIKVIDIASYADDGMPFLVEENIKNAY